MSAQCRKTEKRKEENFMIWFTAHLTIWFIVMLQLSSEVTKMTYIYLCTYIQLDMATSETYILERGGPNMPVCVVTLQKGERDLACW